MIICIGAVCFKNNFYCGLTLEEINKFTSSTAPSTIVRYVMFVLSVNGLATRYSTGVRLLLQYTHVLVYNNTHPGVSSYNRRRPRS